MHVVNVILVYFDLSAAYRSNAVVCKVALNGNLKRGVAILSSCVWALYTDLGELMGQVWASHMNCVRGLN
jgi:hypothetical protein